MFSRNVILSTKIFFVLLVVIVPYSQQMKILKKRLISNLSESGKKNNFFLKVQHNTHQAYYELYFKI